MRPLITRRAVLAAAPALPLDRPSTATSLSAAARASGRFFGCAAAMAQLDHDRGFQAAVARDCGALTPELDLKWAAVEPRRGELDLTAMDALVAFAQAGGKSVHGHTLVWHRSIPDWAAGALGEAEGWPLVQRYFASVMPRYGQVIARWDVVNEPIDPAGPAGLRETAFLRAFGPDYVRRALETARLLAQHGQLMINEYGLEYDDPDGRARRRAFLRLVDRLKAAGAPLDGVGLQAHLDLGRGRLSQRALQGFLHELAARDLFVVVTELDVKEADYALPTRRRDATVAAHARSFLDVALDEPRVKGVTTWGLSDRYSWLQASAGPRVNRGLPLDAALRPKPMRQALLAAFRAAAKSGDSSII